VDGLIEEEWLTRKKELGFRIVENLGRQKEKMLNENGETNCQAVR
jgi:hypothetical protein